MTIINAIIGEVAELVGIDETVTEFPQTFSPPTGYDGLSSVTVQAPANFIASNIKKDVEIAGVTGTYETEFNKQSKSTKATAFPTVLEPDTGYDGLSKATVTAPDNLEAGNIKKDVTIAGVTGTYEPTLQSKDVTPTVFPTAVTADDDYYGLSAVSVKAPDNLDASNIAHGVTIAGVTGTYNSFLPELSAGTLTTVSADDFYGMTSIPIAFFQYQYNLTGVEIPENITMLQEKSFYSCSELKVVDLPSTLQVIGMNCFDYCYQYQPDLSGLENLSELGAYCFAHCGTSGGDWNFTFPNANCGPSSGMFSGCSTLKSVDMSLITDSMAMRNAKGPFMNSGITSAIMPNVTEGGWYELSIGLFYWATKLESIDWPAYNEIPAKTFTGCKSLTNVTIAEGVGNIGRGAFGGCYALKSITLPSTTSWIYQYAFGYIDIENNYPDTLSDDYQPNKNYYPGWCGITSITIPSGAKFTDYCFCGAKDLVSVVMTATTPPTMEGTHVFEDTNANLVITVPKGCLEAYQTATNWSAYADIMVEASE